VWNHSREFIGWDIKGRASKKTSRGISSIWASFPFFRPLPVPFPLASPSLLAVIVESWVLRLFSFFPTVGVTRSDRRPAIVYGISHHGACVKCPVLTDGKVGTFVTLSCDSPDLVSDLTIPNTAVFNIQVRQKFACRGTYLKLVSLSSGLQFIILLTPRWVDLMGGKICSRQSFVTGIPQRGR